MWQIEQTVCVLPFVVTKKPEFAKRSNKSSHQKYKKKQRLYVLWWVYGLQKLSIECIYCMIICAMFVCAYILYAFIVVFSILCFFFNFLLTFCFFLIVVFCCFCLFELNERVSSVYLSYHMILFKHQKWYQVELNWFETISKTETNVTAFSSRCHRIAK